MYSSNLRLSRIRAYLDDVGSEWGMLHLPSPERISHPKPSGQLIHIQAITCTTGIQSIAAHHSSTHAYDDLGTLKQYKVPPASIENSVAFVALVTVFWHSDERPGVVWTWVSGLLRADGDWGKG
ncbi:hypothetical protein EMPG_14323 [Blastomyces silverae]|uniref:Uncharacterized protein n=1 Tax=Blastomyces silverae TaxID=2060906 RepID=A0A0H1BGU8_9EURO|nr:hypothetical protein EMPG_14323 [Blastomyces silverae]